MDLELLMILNIVWSSVSEQTEMSKREGSVEGGRIRRRTFGASVVGGAVTLPSLLELQGKFVKMHHTHETLGIQFWRKLILRS